MLGDLLELKKLLLDVFTGSEIGMGLFNLLLALRQLINLELSHVSDVPLR